MTVSRKNYCIYYFLKIKLILEYEHTEPLFRYFQAQSWYIKLKHPKMDNSFDTELLGW